MTNSDPAIPPRFYSSTARPRTAHRVLPLLVLASLIVFLAGCNQAQPKPAALSGKLNVLVRPADRRLDPIPVEQTGAAPVKSGGAMCIDASLNEPGFIYIVWINSEGQVLPLYPWNNERLEVTDVNERAPERRAGKLIFSPLLGGNWTFSDKPGMETVVLLARRKPLSEGVEIGNLLSSTGVPTVINDSSEVVRITLGRGAKAETGREQQLLADYFAPLAEHFDVVEAVQFEHVK
jgi:hypothetical protein